MARGAYDSDELDTRAGWRHYVSDTDGSDIALRFLVHFLGDLHQPLHLTGRERGGNGAIFKFEGRTRR